jgi:hypothetical protein
MSPKFQVGLSISWASRSRLLYLVFSQVDELGRVISDLAIYSFQVNVYIVHVHNTQIIHGGNHLLNSSRPISPLRRTLMLELLLRRRLLRLSAGSAGLNPLARACRFNTSVRLTTPTRRPERRAPGSADDGMAGARGVGLTYGAGPGGC